MIGKILIVDDVSTNRIVFKVKLTAVGYNTVMAATGAACLRVAQTELPDLILLDVKLPDMPGIEVLQQLKASPVTRRIPVVVFSSDTDQALRLAALQAGAEDFLTRPIDDQTLLARLRGLFRSREVVGGLSVGGLSVGALSVGALSVGGLSPMDQGLGLFGMAEPAAEFEQPGHVTLVMNRIEAALHLRKQLATVAKDQISILTPDDVHAQPNADGIDVYLIDADIGSPGGGLRVMSELLSRGVSRHAAFCIYNQASPNLVPATAFDLGANDLVDQRISPSELAVRLHTLVRRKRDADQMRASVQDGLRLAMIDPLTGLHNRRYGMAQLNAIAARSQHDCTEFAVMVVDLDRFKAVNDRWGHAAGDQVLIEVAGRLAATLRASDLLARIGGEEFLIALPATTLVEAGIVAKRLCHAVQTTATVLPDGTAINVTISIGMTVGGRDYMEGTVADLIDKADRALMQSKSGGRNKVTILTQAA